MKLPVVRVRVLLLTAVRFVSCQTNVPTPAKSPVTGGLLGAPGSYVGLLVHAVGANTFIIVRVMEPLMIIMGLLLACLIREREVAGDANLQTARGL